MDFRNFIEVSDEQLQSLKSVLHKAERGKIERFDHIFGNKLRIVIPLGEDMWEGMLDWWQKASMQKDKRKIRSDYLVQKLAERGYQADLQKGTATSQVKLDLSKVKDQKSRENTKIRTEKIGTILQRLKKYEGKTQTSIIISRSPIDVARMSDHHEINSCHSPPNSKNITDWKRGTFFRCAQQEARSGGAVAYAVLTSELEKVPNLQAPDIFKDRDRKIGGIEPLERLRLRRLSDGKTDVLIPELKSYGVKHVGFVKAVANWAKKSQKDVVEKQPKFKDFNLHGGSYQDNPIATIWNNFFGTHETGTKKSVDDEQENQGQKWTADRLEQVAQETLAAHEKSWKNVFASCDVEEADNQPYLSFWAGLSFEIDEKNFTKEITDDDLRVWGRDNQPMTLGRAIKDVLNNMIIADINFNTYNGKVRLNCSLEHESQGYGVPAEQHRDLYEFEHFLDELDDIDKDYDEHYNAVYRILVEHGFVREEKEEWRFKHFQWKTEKITQVSSEDMWIGDVQGLPTNILSRQSNKSYYSSSYDDTIVVFNSNAIATNAKVIFPSQAIPENAIVFKAEIPGDKQHDDTQPEFFKYPYRLYLKLVIPLKITDIKTLRAIEIIDKHWDYYVQRAVKWWNTVRPTLAAKGTDYSPPMPIKYPKKTQPQNQLNLFKFKDWVITYK